MQVTVYFNRDRARDKELLERLKKKAEEERRSKSATVLTILEEYFESEAEGQGEEGDGPSDREGEKEGTRRAKEN